MTVKKVMSLLLSMPLLFLTWHCGEEAVPEKEAEQPVPVTVMQAELQSLSNSSSYTGTVEADDHVSLSTKIMGWIDQFTVDEGDDVRKGAVLVKMHSKELEAKRAQAEAAIVEAEAHYENTQTNLKRMEALYEKKASTQKELDDIKTAYAGAKARKQAAQEMGAEVDAMLNYTTLKAPFDGVVTAKMMETGDLANPGQPILEVEKIDQVKIIAKVPERDVQALQVGMPVEVEIRASHSGSNGQKFLHKIDRIVPSADPMTRQFEIHIRIDNPSGNIKPGMFARVSVGEANSSTLLVPRTSVFRRGQLQGLFVVDDENRAHLRWIRTGKEQDNQIEVLSGLSPGEQIVTDGLEQLMDGQAVEVR